MASVVFSVTPWVRLRFGADFSLLPPPFSLLRDTVGVALFLGGLRDNVCAVCWYPVVFIGLASASTLSNTSVG